MVRAKFKLVKMSHTCWNEGSKVLTFQPQYDTSLPEDQRFSKATPSGTLEMQVDNPAALAQLTLGQEYYLDLTPVPKE